MKSFMLSVYAQGENIQRLRYSNPCLQVIAPRSLIIYTVLPSLNSHQ